MTYLQTLTYLHTLLLLRLDQKPLPLQQHLGGGWQCDEEEAVVDRYPTAGCWHVLFLCLIDIYLCIGNSCICTTAVPCGATGGFLPAGCC